MVSMTCGKHGPNRGKNDKIILPLQHWGLCLPHGHMLSVHLWIRLSAFILKYFMQNLNDSLVAKRTGPSMVRTWVAQWIHRSHLTRRGVSVACTIYASTSVWLTLWGKAKDTATKISIMQNQLPCISPNKFIAAITGMIVQVVLLARSHTSYRFIMTYWGSIFHFFLSIILKRYPCNALNTISNLKAIFYDRFKQLSSAYSTLYDLHAGNFCIHCF